MNEKELKNRLKILYQRLTLINCIQNILKLNWVEKV